MTSMEIITLISRRRASTQKGPVTHLKKGVKVVLVMIEKKLSLWKSKQIFMKTRNDVCRRREKH
jgi:hypothetical protein